MGPTLLREDPLYRGVRQALLKAALPPDATLVLAWSGGQDSTVLLDLLMHLAPELSYGLVAAHIDHGMRPTSVRDAAFCRALARERGIALEVIHLTPGELSGQAAARQARYAALADLASQHRAAALLTAHHGDDLLESALMNLLRGSGLDGLASLRADALIPHRGATGRLLRPLLFAESADLSDYARRHGLTWVEDPTNAEDTYLRNRLRQRVTPALREIAGDLKPARRTLHNLEMERDAARHAADQLYQRARRPTLTPDARAFDAHTLLEAPRATATRMLLTLEPAWDAATLERILALLPRAFTTTPARHCVRGHLVWASHGRLSIEPCAERGAQDLLRRRAPLLRLPTTERGQVEWLGTRLRWSTLAARQVAPDCPQRPWRHLITEADWSQGLVLRAPRQGDRLEAQRPEGTTWHRDARTIFQSHHLGTDVRWAWPCLAHADDRLIWICGLAAEPFPRPHSPNARWVEVIVEPATALSAILQWQRK
ncbi:tRNA lysidine(34) synthetase TilS [Lujinxingia litoralis]|uniref:tRNA(Ile)-lysidine synthase n=1 Tax=Lujinxingia litoralis TaxID=2211119 RepID=A0A328C4V5_9DELT|nr:tRNA lysidine(34) synthetase TilS [Lujinxingia litoralis]RAL21625.1 tRNA lysidine(34) synthetase TilS [Lujinxingia litoralis]